MSQPTNPYPQAFNYGDGYFVAHQPFSQWVMPQGSRPAAAAPSPSPAAPPRTPANPRSSSRASWTSPMTRDPTMDQALNSSLLAPPQALRPRSIESVDNLDPITRFYNDDPWSSQNPRGSGVAVPRPYYAQSSIDYGSARGGPGSEVESLTHRSDSGYYTHHAQSVISNEPEPQELPPEMTLQVGNLHVGSAHSDTNTDTFRMTGADHTSQYSGRSTTQGKEFRCEHCSEISKCKSDHKKHMLKHNKPFKCEMPNCRRAGKGFTTENDLARHKKSVHRIGMLSNSWQCASDTCRNREKIWPRLDNFKQHIHRMHPDEDEADLIRRSAYTHVTTSGTQSLSVAPMDTTLAGIGTEKQFPGNDFDDHVTGISLTPDQDSSHWNSFDANPHDFAMDVDQSGSHDYSQDSRRDSAFRIQASFAAYELNAGTTTRPDSNLERLDALAAIASSQPSDKPVLLPSPQLSNAPQTKADQQRQALQKFSKIIVQDIKNSSNGGETLDLEDVVMRILSGATDAGKRSRHRSQSTQASPTDASSPDSDGDTLTKGEALRASQAISALIKQSGKPTPTRPRSYSNKGFRVNKLSCERCNVTLARSCDMRKHMKRHTKPYGCTYPKCHKRFGAKSDWKRHENSQHFQLECFRCQILSPSSQTHCGELFYRAEMFTEHLQTQHHMDDLDEQTREVRLRRIGKNGQGQFWCGFCEDIIKLEKKRNAAWDERFDHIDRHFCKDGRAIEDWLCVEAKKKKGDVAKEVDKWAFDEEEEEVYAVSPDAQSTGRAAQMTEESRQSSVFQAQSMNLSADVETSTSLSQSSNAPNPRKRPLSSNLPDLATSLMTSSSSSSSSLLPPPPSPQKRARTDIVRYCCSCQSGPWVLQAYVDCMTCNHHLCKSCPVVGSVLGGDVGIAGMG